ncbi:MULTISPECIES: GtrA family protein [Rhodopseudomonas]|uniref:Polysaccharide synthesis protein GtrA n=1 Tax=Rhodopseudomonas palustris TaxID=1076 RepID=A0A0D7F506_RHOPL|nr:MULTISPECIES: GtrA family protein [Rhodopseudomonas]KIZ48189.1 polysaccharide synthesis protein GtrA [Rhodopseudomonas palustris]MDF3810007.1 GtrA family protein [Rhodopseudomonas sp. BAL398]WOK20435.1 GtrA family protein [Rhodopseudomonas sp. BAL398]
MTPLFRRLLDLWHARPLASKMVSFAAIGAGNTVLDFGIFTLAFKVLELPLIPSNILAWLVAVSLSYVLNTMITFRAESGRVLKRRDYFSFVASGSVGVVANTATLVVLSNFMPVLGAKLIAILVSFAINFAMSHFVVFRRKLPSNP